MKKLFLIVALLIGLSAYSQSKTDYCKIYQSFLEDEYPGTKVTYDKDTLIVTFKLSVFADKTGTDVKIARILAKDQKSMDQIGLSFSKGLRTEYEIFHKQGFYFVKFRFKDSNYKIFSSKNYKI